jgi:hypothetical protein
LRPHRLLLGLFFSCLHLRYGILNTLLRILLRNARARSDELRKVSEIAAIDIAIGECPCEHAARFRPDVLRRSTGIRLIPADAASAQGQCESWRFHPAPD